MNRYFPVNLNIYGRRCIVVGGGKVAERKVFELLHSGAEVTVSSPDLSDALQKLAKEKIIGHIPEKFSESILAGAFLVISAADDATNRRVAKEAKKLGVLANVADAPSLCDFILPAVMRRGGLMVAVSTGGGCPALSSAIRDEIAKIYPDDYAVYVNKISRARDYIHSHLDDPGKRAEAIKKLIAENSVQEIIDLSETKLCEYADRVIEE